MRRRFLRVILCLGVAATLAVPGVSRAATIVNGGFETGNFSGWTVVNQPGGSGAGDWFVYTGTSSPLIAFQIAAPPEGTYAAVSDQLGRGSHLLYQDVALEAGYNHTLSLQVYYENGAAFYELLAGAGFATPPSLDFNVSPNQQYRIDILRPSAPVDSVAPGDVLATVFQTDVGDPPSLAPTPVSFDLSGFAGTTVRIRFAEVDNQGYFQASVDDVAVTSTRTVPTTKDQCKNGGWRDFGTLFKNQGDCVSFVATGARRGL